jgi:TRAP-type C4-dicarboxylate transport system permease small subunit
MNPFLKILLAFATLLPFLWMVVFAGIVIRFVFSDEYFMTDLFPVIMSAQVIFMLISFVLLLIYILHTR